MPPSTPCIPSRSARQGRLIRSRWSAIGAAVAVTLGGGGLIGTAAAAPAGAQSALVQIVPCRFVDTRGGAPVAAAETLTFSGRGARGGCDIPAAATGLLLNVIAVDPVSSGYLTLFPSGAGQPGTSSLNWSAGNGATANEITSKLSDSGRFSLFASTSTDVVIDVVGYLVPASSGSGGIGPKGDTGPAGPAGPAGPGGGAVIPFRSSEVVGSGIDVDFFDGPNYRLFVTCGTGYSDVNPKIEVTSGHVTVTDARGLVELGVGKHRLSPNDAPAEFARHEYMITDSDHQAIGFDMLSYFGDGNTDCGVAGTATPFPDAGPITG